MRLNAATLVRCGVPADKARAHLPHISSAMREHEITTPLRARMFLAQVMHESAALRYFEEIASGAAYEGRADLGNTQPGDGRRFKGRGPIQLTGRHNYTLYGKLLGIDLAGHPEIAATPRVGWRVSALFFERAGCNDAADRRDFRDVTRRINGGYNGYDDRVRYFRLLGGTGVVPGPGSLGVGDKGDAVVTMTRRLSFVHPRGGEDPYLDGTRKRFDEEAERALRAFQRDRKLEVDGRYGPQSTRALARATEREKERRERERERQARREERLEERDGRRDERDERDGRRDERDERDERLDPRDERDVRVDQRDERDGWLDERDDRLDDRLDPRDERDDRRRDERDGRRRPADRGPRRRSTVLLDRLDRLDARGDELRSALLDRHRELLRALERRRRLGPEDLERLGRQLGKLDDVIHEMRDALAAEVATAEPAAPEGGNGIVTQAASGGTVAVAEQVATEVAPPSTEELIERLVALDAESDRVRALLADRFRELEDHVADLRPARRRRRRDAPPRDGGRRRERGGDRVETPRDTPPEPRRRPLPPEDGPNGEGARVRAEEHSFRVRQSKVALARFLARHRKQSTGKLRRTLLREVRSPRAARVATPAWERAVKEAQAVAGLPVTGELDGALQRALRKDWPSESALRRIVRGTPAWRALPGQVSPNFNLREFACTDGTSYVDGLVREQGLTKAQAMARAKQLADRLERVRAANGGRPLRVSSVFRTKSYNSRIPGSATNSAHLSGHAVDMPTPPGVPIATHHKHVLAAFESGVGLYTASNFVHGDFKPGGRRTW